MKLYFGTREKARNFARTMTAKQFVAKVIDHDKVEDKSSHSVNGTRFGVEYFNFKHVSMPTIN